MLTRRLSTLKDRRCIRLLCSLPEKKIDHTPETPTSENIPVQIDPFQHEDYFGVHNLFTVKTLFDAKVHYGHKEGSLNVHMKPYIYGSRLGHLIFDLDVTAFHLRKALNFCAHIAYRDGIILFVAQNRRIATLVENTALETKEFAHTRYWLFGTFTNSVRVFKTGIRLPDLCIFVNTLDEIVHEHRGITEAAKLNIPTIGIVDTNCSPNLITYPVPGNDDSLSSIHLYLNLFKRAILRGKTERLKDLNKQQSNTT